jgi:hypothetical protein
MIVRYVDFSVSAALVRKNLISPQINGLNNTTPNAQVFHPSQTIIPYISINNLMFLYEPLSHNKVLGRYLDNMSHQLITHFQLKNGKYLRSFYASIRHSGNVGIDT